MLWRIDPVVLFDYVGAILLQVIWITTIDRLVIFCIIPEVFDVSDFKLNPLGEGKLSAPVDRVGLTAHVALPRIRS